MRVMMIVIIIRIITVLLIIIVLLTIRRSDKNHFRLGDLIPWLCSGLQVNSASRERDIVLFTVAIDGQRNYFESQRSRKRDIVVMC